MPTTTWLHPSLWRVVIFAMILGLSANFLLWWVANEDDAFAKIISVASLITAVLLAVAWLRFPKYIGNVLLIVFAIWIANTIEFLTVEGPPIESKLRQSGLYVSEALLALGAYVATRAHSLHDGQ